MSNFKRKGFNKYKIVDDYAIIYLIKKNGDVYETKVDIDDIEKLKKLDYSWHCVYKENTESNYARSSVYYSDGGTRKKCRMVYLHNVIMNKGDSEVVDHKYHDTLDNRKKNLRVTENKKNLRNRKGANSNNNTGYRNVNYIENNDEYWVQIMKDGKRYKWIFSIDEFEEACKFAEKKRKEIFGEFAGAS
jgi:hypothetical protein